MTDRKRAPVASLKARKFLRNADTLSSPADRRDHGCRQPCPQGRWWSAHGSGMSGSVKTDPRCMSSAVWLITQSIRASNPRPPDPAGWSPKLAARSPKLAIGLSGGYPLGSAPYPRRDAATRPLRPRSAVAPASQAGGHGSANTESRPLELRTTPPVDRPAEWAHSLEGDIEERPWKGQPHLALFTERSRPTASVRDCKA